MDYLQDQIGDLKREVDDINAEWRRRINSVSENMGKKINQANEAVKDIEKKVERASVGSIKIQVFGVLLMIYGSVSGYLA